MPRRLLWPRCVLALAAGVTACGSGWSTDRRGAVRLAAQAMPRLPY